MYINLIQDLSKEANLIAAEALVPSHINYGINIWSTTNITQLKRAKKNYRSAAKVAIGRASKYEHATPLLNKLQYNGFPTDRKLSRSTAHHH